MILWLLGGTVIEASFVIIQLGFKDRLKISLLILGEFEQTGYFRNLFYATVAFITYWLEVFLQTFYARLPCFGKHKKRGFGYCQSYPIFSSVLLNLWMIKG